MFYVQHSYIFKQPTEFPAPQVLFSTLMTCALIRPCELCKTFHIFHILSPISPRCLHFHPSSAEAKTSDLLIKVDWASLPLSSSPLPQSLLMTSDSRE